MAKGFTVKAKSPVTSDSQPEWDYNLAKEIVKNVREKLRIIKLSLINK